MQCDSSVDQIHAEAGTFDRLVAGGGARQASSLSRDRPNVVAGSGLITLTGGKWTTYRKMAEDVVDRAERVSGLEGRPGVTAGLAIHGADGYGEGVGQVSDLPMGGAGLGGHVGDLPYWRIYGGDAAGIADLIAREPALGARLHPALGLCAAEVVWQARHEMARTVEDVLARRTRSLVLDARAAGEAAPTVAQVLARELGRDADWVAAQVRRFAAITRGWSLPTMAAEPRIA